MAMDSLYSTGQAMINPLITLWNGFVDLVPSLIAAIILAIIGWVIAVVIEKVVTKVLTKLKFDEKIKKANLTDKIGHLELSHLAGGVLKWYVFVIFLGEAFALISLGNLSVMINTFLFWLPNVILALIIIIIGLILADFVAERLVRTKIKSVRVLSVIVKIAILFFAFVIAFKQIGLYVSIAENTFLILLGAVALGLAIAFGIGFGMALKDEAKNILNDLKGKL
ncbi:hypothetical protein JXB02_06770 [Candidatus Woesearchaeota archaeon]|nr:hypothetical protein [Candidatus Woesearchaeota archaeon]